MSRIGRLPVTIPAGVTVTVDGTNVVKCKRTKRGIVRKYQSGYQSQHRRRCSDGIAADG